MNLYTRGIKKSIVLVIMIVLINSLILGATAGNIEEYQFNNMPKEDKKISDARETEEQELINYDMEQFEQHHPIGARSNKILGTLIGPGNYSGSVDPVTNMIDNYTIHLNGTSGNTDNFIVRIGTLSTNMGFFNLFNPDMFQMNWAFFNDTNYITRDRYAITSGYHYIMILSPFAGTINYWLNITVAQTTNGQNDANNDFANATAVSDGSNIQESLNITSDYWDVFNITIPQNRTLTVTCEFVSGDKFNPFLELYDAPNSSSIHLLAKVDEGGTDEDDVLKYTSNTTQIDGYLRVELNKYQSYLPYGDYWINFTIREINSRPHINLSDPILNTWMSSSGLSINEDEVSSGEINLSHHFMDDGKPSSPGVLEYTYSSSDETNISVVIHPNTNVTITPIANWYGNAVVTFFANDSFVKISDDLNITVNSVNDKPILNLTNDWEIDPSTADNMTIVDSNNLGFTQGLYVSFKVIAHDIDNALLTYSLDLDITNTSLAVDAVPFYIGSSTGNLAFTPTNDWIGSIDVNITVSDGTDTDYHTFTFRFDNANDDPMVKMVNTAAIANNAASITGTDGATQDEQFDFTVTAMDLDIDIGIMDTLTFGATSDDVTISDDGAYGNMTYNFSFTPDNDNALIGYVLVNVTVKDHAGSGWDDWAMVNINVANVNDAPVVALVGSTKPVDHLSDQGQINADETMNVTITGEDIDGQTLSCAATGNTKVTALSGSNKWNVTFMPTDDDEGTTIINVTVSDGTDYDFVHLTWLVIATPNTAPSITITSDDNKKAKTSDKIIIEGTYTDADGDTLEEIQTKLEFPDDTKTDFYKVGYTEDAYNDLSESHRTGQLIPGVYVWEYLTINTDGTWKYMFDTGTYNSAYDWYEINANDMMDMFGLVAKVTEGDMIFTFKAIDEYDLESDEQSITTIYEDDGGVTIDLTLGPIKKDTTLIEGAKVTITIDGVEYDGTTNALGIVQITLPNIPADGTYKVKVTHTDYDDLEYDLEFSNGVYDSVPPKDMKSISEPPDDKKDDDDEDEKTLSMGLFDYDILIIIVVIIIVIVLVLMMIRKKKPTEERMLPPPEGAAVAPTEVTCTACGTIIPGGAEICPNCGAAAPMPPPAEAPPTAPVDIYCQSCGAIIPTDAPACPSCGAASPMQESPPGQDQQMYAEAPPQEGMPSEQTYEEPPPQYPETMPPEQTYEEPLAPQEGEGMPPEQTYMEQPPPPQEGMSPEQTYMEQQYMAQQPQEGMPPPPQQPPPDYGAPPEQQYIEQPLPPAGLANCPQCGNQIPFGATPCPACGTTLNW